MIATKLKENATRKMAPGLSPKNSATGTEKIFEACRCCQRDDRRPPPLVQQLPGRPGVASRTFLGQANTDQRSPRCPCASDSTASLRGLHDAIEMNLRSLKALGGNIDQAFFVSVLTGKLPRQTMVQMEIQIGGQAWTPSLFRTTLSNLIRAQESADRLTSQHSYRGNRDQPSTSFDREVSCRVHRPRSTCAHVGDVSQFFHPGADHSRHLRVVTHSFVSVLPR